MARVFIKIGEKMKTMPKLHKKKCVICQKEFMFRTGIAGRHKQIRRNYSVRFPISQTCSKKCHYVYEAVRSGIMKRINKKGIICSTCGFPTEWERNPVFIKDDIFSLINVEENTCKECGHQTDGYTIKKIEQLLRKFREAGKQEAIKEHNCSDEASDTFCPICFNNGRQEATRDFKKMIDELENPYPEDIFPKLELSEFQTSTINDFLISNLKFTLDRLSAELMRKARNNLKKELKQKLKEKKCL